MLVKSTTRYKKWWRKTRCVEEPAQSYCSVVKSRNLSPLLTHLVLQDPVPPEVTGLLLKSDNPLLHQLFYDKDTKNQTGKELSKVTVVSKFKVGAVTCCADTLAQLCLRGSLRRSGCRTLWRA